MEETQESQEKKYIPVIQVAQELGATSDAVVGLCKTGTLQCREVNGVWFVDPVSFSNYQKEYQQDEKPHSQSQGSDFTYYSESDEPLIPETKKSIYAPVKALPPSNVVSTFIHKGVAVAIACMVVLGSLYVSDMNRLGGMVAHVSDSVSGKTTILSSTLLDTFTYIDAMLLPVVRVVEETRVVIDSALYDIDRFGYFMLEHYRTEVVRVPYHMLYSLGENIVTPFENVLAMVLYHQPFEQFIAFGEDVYVISDKAAHATAQVMSDLMGIPKEIVAFQGRTFGRVFSGMQVAGDVIIHAEEHMVANVSDAVGSGLGTVHTHLIQRPAQVIRMTHVYVSTLVGSMGESFGKAVGIHVSKE